MKIFGFAGWSGSGKTTLIEELIPRFVKHGLSVSIIKHAHHSFDVDQPGKDSFRHRQAGCKEVVVVSEKRWAIMHELRGEAEPSLEEQIGRVSSCDLLLVEGYKHYPLPKLEIWRKENAKPLLHPADEHIVAIASDTALETKLPRFDLNDRDGIGNFILSYIGFR
jgi:molybdopterin-guanine dinucleotide biosynthesis protein B